MADLTITPFVNGSLTDTLPASAAAGGDSVPAYTGKEWIEVNNGGGSPINVSLVSQITAVPGIAAANLLVAVPAGARRKLKAPAPVSTWTDVNGKLQIIYSAVTTVTVGVFKWPE